MRYLQQDPFQGQYNYAHVSKPLTWKVTDLANRTVRFTDAPPPAVAGAILVQRVVAPWPGETYRRPEPKPDSKRDRIRKYGKLGARMARAGAYDLDAEIAALLKAA